MAADRSIEVVEVGPRDGLQNEDIVLATERKVALIEDLTAAGVTRIEAVSFAHPRHVPQMADAEAVMAALTRAPDTTYIGLVMNRRGWQRAAEAAVDEVNMPVFATDTFNRRNQGTDTDGSLTELAAITAEAHAADTPITGTISVAWGCPFEGEVAPDTVVEIASRMADMGVDEIAVADTIGVADPWAVRSLVSAVSDVAGGTPLRVHFHDTRSTGIANTFAAIEAGVRRLDASVGGLGGCPFAPAATGNIATDDLLYMLDRAGFATGISLEGIVGISRAMGRELGRDLPAMVPRAGGFPTGTGAR